MADLLDENDFYSKAIEPWRWFIPFYIITLSIFLTIFFITEPDPGPSPLSILIMLAGLPLTTTFLMIFSKKNYKLIRLKTIALSICLMMALYFSCFIALLLMYRKDIFSEDGFYGTIVLLIIYGVLAGICIAIILPIIKRKQKKEKIRFTAN